MAKNALIELATKNMLSQAASHYKIDDIKINPSNQPHFSLCHDRFGAPYVKNIENNENKSILISKTDEDDIELTVWVEPNHNSQIIGFGVDMVAYNSFMDRHRDFFVKSLFSSQDLQVIKQLPLEAPKAYSFAFSAKEAAFKACSQPMRNLIDKQEIIINENQRYPLFEVRSFELKNPTHMQMAPPKHDGGITLKNLGISRIDVRKLFFDRYVVTMAFALK